METRSENRVKGRLGWYGFVCGIGHLADLMANFQLFEVRSPGFVS
jgi:hypothetical protein